MDNGRSCTYFNVFLIRVVYLFNFTSRTNIRGRPINYIWKVGKTQKLSVRPTCSVAPHKPFAKPPVLGFATKSTEPLVHSIIYSSTDYVYELEDTVVYGHLKKMTRLTSLLALVAVLLAVVSNGASYSGSGPHIADVNILLPPKMTHPVEYRLQGSDGCFKWYYSTWFYQIVFFEL